MHRGIYIGLILSFLMCYLDIGHDGAVFLAEAEYYFIAELVNDFKVLLNPFAICAFLGQLLLMVAVFKRKHSKPVSLVGLILLYIIIVPLLLLAFISVNWKMLISIAPFLILTFVYFQQRHKLKLQEISEL